MFKHLVALVIAVLAGAFVSPAIAQQPPGTSVGTLTCKMAPSIGLIFGSRQRMACRFTPNGPNPPEAYVGVMGTIGLDIGITAGGVMAPVHPVHSLFDCRAGSPDPPGPLVNDFTSYAMF